MVIRWFLVLRSISIVLLVFSVQSSLAGTVISTPADGDRFMLCGSANVSKTDAVLAHDPDGNLNFQSSQPVEFPDPYWGILPNEVYMCLDSTKYNDSTWNLPGVVRQGAFNTFNAQILGFKTDSSGNRIDVTGDGRVDYNDWTALRYYEIFSGSSVQDSFRIRDAFRDHWQSRGTGGRIEFSRYQEDYPRRVDIWTHGGGRYLSAEVSSKNRYNCTGAWEECYTYSAFTGSEISLAPKGPAIIQNRDFAHRLNRWIRFDPMHDRFTAHDRNLRRFLRKIAFAPRFWVLAKENRHGYLLP